MTDSDPDEFQSLLEQTSLYADPEIRDAYDDEAADRYARGPGAPLTEEMAAKVWAAARREPTCTDAEVSIGGHWWPTGAVDGDRCRCGDVKLSLPDGSDLRIDEMLAALRAADTFYADPNTGVRRTRPTWRRLPGAGPDRDAS